VLLLSECFCCLFRYHLSPETFGYTLLLPYNGHAAWGLDEVLTTPHRNKQLVTKCNTGRRNRRAFVSAVMNLRVLQSDSKLLSGQFK
jgi:hypothetical protein